MRFRRDSSIGGRPGTTAALPAAVLALALIAGPAAPAEERGQFAFSVSGIRAGVLVYEGEESNGRYEARGTAQSSGLVRQLFQSTVTVVAQGRVDGNRYLPSVYREVVTDREGTVQRDFRFRGGGIEIDRRPPRDKPRKHAADPTGQGDALDPMSAAFALLRDRPRALACAIDLSVFDGARRARIRLNEPEPDSDGLTCRGAYMREAGFSPEEMAERRVWPLTLRYEAQADDQLRVQEIRFHLSFGSARLRRQ